MRLGNGLTSADRRHRAFIDVSKILTRLLCQIAENILRGCPAHLHCGRADAGNRLAVFLLERSHIANDEDVTKTSYSEIGFDKNASRLIGFHAQSLAQRRRRDTRRPQDNIAVDPFVTYPDTARIDICHKAVKSNLDSGGFELDPCAVGQIAGKCAKHAVGAFEKQNLCLSRVNCHEIFRQCLPSDAGDRTRKLNAGRAAADNDKIQLPLIAVKIGVAFGILERKQNPPSDLDRVLDCFQPGSLSLPIVVPKISMTGPGSDDQIVVCDLGTVGQRDAIVFLIKPSNITQNDLDILEFMQDTSDRLCDLAGRKHRRRDLIKQRLKNVVIFAIDQRDLNRPVSKLFGRRQPAKTAADNHYFWFVCLFTQFFIFKILNSIYYIVK